MKRTKQQIQNIITGCKLKRNNDLIKEAQKKRHFKNKINDLILKSITTQKNISTTKNWIKRLEEITDSKTMEILYKEIQKQQ